MQHVTKQHGIHFQNISLDQGDAAYSTHRVLVSCAQRCFHSPIHLFEPDRSVHQTTSSPVRFKRGFRYEVDRQGRILSHDTFYVPICHIRILPRPAFQTIAPFSNIKFLCLNAAAVIGSRFHQIEGIVKKAVQTCDKLERVEVRSDVASVAWRDALQTKALSDNTNHLWIARLNKGIRMRAKLKAVDSLGLSWPWFWQAPERKRLTWRE